MEFIIVIMVLVFLDLFVLSVLISNWVWIYLFLYVAFLSWILLTLFMKISVAEESDWCLETLFKLLVIPDSMS